MTRRTAAALVCALAVFAAACSPGGGDGDDTDAASVTVTETVTAPRGSANGGDFERIPEVVDRVEPSVVTVATDTGEGSGVVWNDDGIIVTNDHVVDGASAVEVVLASGAELPATVEASTPDYDLAVLRVDREGLPAATFSSELPEVGELAVAIGNPLGFEQSVTAGIVSGLHRQIPSGGTTRALVDLIQTDAAISPGNSGGALVNADGEVIGINVAYIPPQQGSVSLGFAIPSETVIEVVRQLLETGRVEQAYLGIYNPTTVTPELAEQFDLPAEEGVVFNPIERGGPADRAGLEPGDVIVSIDGKEIRTVEDLFAELRRRKPGDKVSVGIQRSRGRDLVDVTLGEAPQR